MERSSAQYLAPLAVVAAAGALYGLRTMRKRQTAKPQKIGRAEAAFDSALLVLSVPSFLDPKTIIRNDELLTKAVKRTFVLPAKAKQWFVLMRFGVKIFSDHVR